MNSHLDEKAGKPNNYPDLLIEAYTRKGAMSVNDFCAWANMGRNKFYRLVKQGDLTTRKIHGSTVVTMPDALRWLENLPEAA